MIPKNRKFQKRESRHRDYSFVIWMLFLLLLLSFLVVSNWKISRRTAELKIQAKKLQDEIQALEKKNQELKEGISQTGKEKFLEEVAYKSLDLKKPGEEVVVVLRPEKKEEPEKEKPFWRKIFDPVRNFFKNF